MPFNILLMKKIWFALFLAISFNSFAQIPEYYQSINLNLNGEDLKQELATLITYTHTVELVYTPEVWNVLKQADQDPTNEDKVLLLYGWNDLDLTKNNDRTRDRNASCHTSSCEDKWVREHVFPRSKGTPNLNFEGPGSDAHHLHAIDYDRNSLRSNFKFIANPTPYITYSREIQQNGVSYFYPGDEWKGDVARMVMYMYLRYDIQCQPVNVGYGSTTYAPNGDIPDIFLKWNAEDPVSEHEINRNNKIYAAQGNRNPFIDNPFLATKIWNGPNAENKWENLNINKELENEFKIYPTYTTSKLFLEDTPEHYHYKISDLSGKIIVEKSNQVGNVIDVDFLKSGLYFIQLNTDQKNSTLKFIKK